MRDAPSFRPSWWLPGRHLQTLGGKYLRRPPPLAYRRERIETPDGDFVDLDFGPDQDPDRPLVLILHGLEGFSHRPYVVFAVAALAELGIASAALNFRSCSGEPNRLPRLYHSGETGDTAHILRLLRDRWPGRPLGALGYSLGGNVLLKLLGEREDGGRDLLQAAVGVSVPYDLAAGSAFLEKGVMGGIYARYFLEKLKRKVEAKRALLAPLLDLDQVFSTHTLRQFDDHATGPLHGFRDAADYYGQASCNQFLEGIRVPTLLVHARNDPFLPAEAIPHREVEANPFLSPAFTRTGGHVGFVSGSVPGRISFWSEVVGGSFLQKALLA